MAGPTLSPGPAARRARQRRRHGQRLRGGEDPASPRRVFLVGSGLRAAEPLWSRADQRRRPAETGHALRRLQGGQRGDGARLLGGASHCLDGLPAPQRLRSGTRFRPYRRSDARDESRRAGAAVSDQVGRCDRSIYAEDVARACLAAADSRLEGARVYNLHGESARIADVLRLIETIRPNARGLITHVEPPIPFPTELADPGYQRDLGPQPRTGLREGVANTLDEFEALHKAGRLDDR